MGYCERVREFTSLANENLPQKPKLMEKKDVEFIRHMVSDEMVELEMAVSITEQADALLDAIYYICDCAVKHGINLDEVFDEVHAANMAKVVDGKLQKDERGKVLKPEDWQPPSVNKVITRQLIDGTWESDGEK